MPIDTTRSPHALAPEDQWCLDPTALAQLRALESPKRPGFVATTLRMFLTQAPEALANLEAALGCGDADGGRQAAHTLKSTSALIGANALSSVCERIEALARRGTLDPARPLLREAVAGYQSVEDQLVRIIDSESHG